MTSTKSWVFLAEDRIYGDETFSNEIEFKEQVIKILTKSNNLTNNAEVFFERKDGKSYSDTFDFNFINKDLSKEQLEEYKNKIEKSKRLKDKFNRLNWELILCNTPHKLSEDFIRVFKEYIGWVYISRYCEELSKEFIQEFKNEIVWDDYLFNHKLSEDYIKNNLMEIIKENSALLRYIFFSQKFSNELFDEFAKQYEIFSTDILHYVIKNSEKITPEFLEKYEDKLPDFFWQSVSKNPNQLSTEFLERFKDKLNWYTLCKTQSFTLEQIEQFKDVINFTALLQSRAWSDERRREIIKIMKTVEN
jgi:hypothetical protein